MGASAHLVPDEGSYLLEYRQFRERLIKLRRVWEEFTKTGQVTEPEALKPEVLASWKRCRARMLDPYDSPNMVSLSPDELKNRLEEYRQVIGIATPFLQALARSVQGSGFRIDFFDRELFLLAQYGDEEALREAKEHGSTPGVSRSEINCGTSAVNLAARLQQPVQLVGPEHYKVALHYWT
ncbi:MAG: sigma-54-dependent Fis family transcriptional regulator, partial [Bacillota bacterium]